MARTILPWWMLTLVTLVTIQPKLTLGDEVNALLEKYSSHCCPRGAELTQSGCSDGSNVYEMLNCTHGQYMLDPNDVPEDAFEERQNGQLMVQGYEDGIVESGNWCVAIGPYGSEPVAIVCFDPEEVDGSTKVSREVMIVYGVCMLVSVGFMILTLAVYAVLPEMRDLQGKCLMAYVASLALAFVPLSILQFIGHSIPVTLCIFKAFLLYFWLLSAFFWLNVVSFNVWRTVVFRSGGRPEERPIFLYYCLYAWGVPCMFLLAAIGAHESPNHFELLRPNFGESSCWFKGPEETWAYFYGPVAVLLTFNVGFFASTAYKLWKSGDMSISGQRLRSQRFKCLLYLKLFMVMGILWIFEVLSFIAAKMTWFWYITDVLNCLQGVLIFILMVCRKRTMRAIASREWGKELCFQRTHHVLSGQVEEEEDDGELEPSGPEEVELSKSNVPTTNQTAVA